LLEHRIRLDKVSWVLTATPKDCPAFIAMQSRPACCDREMESDWWVEFHRRMIVARPMCVCKIVPDSIAAATSPRPPACQPGLLLRLLLFEGFAAFAA
jgi:hypothetical protein